MNKKNLQDMLNTLGLIGTPYNTWVTQKLYHDEPIYQDYECNLGETHHIAIIGNNRTYEKYTSNSYCEYGYKCKICDKYLIKTSGWPSRILNRYPESRIKRGILEHDHQLEWSILYTNAKEKEPLWLKRGLKND